MIELINLYNRAVLRHYDVSQLIIIGIAKKNGRINHGTKIIEVSAPDLQRPWSLHMFNIVGESRYIMNG